MVNIGRRSFSHTAGCFYGLSLTFGTMWGCGAEDPVSPEKQAAAAVGRQEAQDPRYSRRIELPEKEHVLCESAAYRSIEVRTQLEWYPGQRDPTRFGDMFPKELSANHRAAELEVWFDWHLVDVETGQESVVPTTESIDRWSTYWWPPTATVDSQAELPAAELAGKQVTAVTVGVPPDAPWADKVLVHVLRVTDVCAPRGSKDEPLVTKEVYDLTPATRTFIFPQRCTLDQYPGAVTVGETGGWSIANRTERTIPYTVSATVQVMEGPSSEALVAETLELFRNKTEESPNWDSAGRTQASLTMWLERELREERPDLERLFPKEPIGLAPELSRYSSNLLPYELDLVEVSFIFNNAIDAAALDIEPFMRSCQVETEASPIELDEMFAPGTLPRKSAPEETGLTALMRD